MNLHITICDCATANDVAGSYVGSDNNVNESACGGVQSTALVVDILRITERLSNLTVDDFNISDNENSGLPVGYPSVEEADEEMTFAHGVDHNSVAGSYCAAFWFKYEQMSVDGEPMDIDDHGYDFMDVSWP